MLILGNIVLREGFEVLENDVGFLNFFSYTSSCCIGTKLTRTDFCLAFGSLDWSRKVLNTSLSKRIGGTLE